MKKILWIVILILAIASLAAIWKLERQELVGVISQTELGKKDLIRLSYPHDNDTIDSPLLIKGEARGYWFFEGSFPVILTDWDGLIIGEGFATAQGEWMTTDFVPFTATLTFITPQYKNNGSLILKRDNPSGLPENDDALEINIFFSK